MVGTANDRKSPSYVGSKRCTALTRPRQATWVRSSSGPPRLRNRLATDSATSRFSSTTSSRSRLRTRSLLVAAARWSRRAVASRRSWREPRGGSKVPERGEWSVATNVRREETGVNVMRSSQHLAGLIPLAVDFSETKAGRVAVPRITTYRCLARKCHGHWEIGHDGGMEGEVRGYIRWAP